ncbi:MAG: peptidylprolyl isomerase [Sedimentisphaerales bacterium]|nr:peptidylprolyl isomerase [Sedimentisphaerales bacterium]
MQFKSGIIALVMGLVLCGTVIAVQYPQVKLDVTGGVTGSITIELYTDKAPVTCDNFIKYVQSGFYNDLIFHRVMKDFMIQGGGFDQNLIQKPTLYSPIINESTNRLSNLRGTVAMARTDYPHSATSQFFINDVNNTFLDYGAVAYNGKIAYAVIGYCVFGKVVAGIDVVHLIANVATNDSNVPLTPIKIASVTILNPVCIEKLGGDIDGDCRVDFNDFAMLAADWLQSNSLTACTYTIVGDLNYDCTVNFKDVAMLAQNWFVSVSGPPCTTALTGDTNNDCHVDFKDLSALITHWLESSQ